MVSQVNGRKRFSGSGLGLEVEDGYNRIKLKGSSVGGVREAWSLERVTIEKDESSCCSDGEGW